VERRDEPGTEDKSVLLGLLAAVERDSAVTQRHLARELGIALGLANAYLRRCAKKGLIKMRQAPLNRYAYYLTPRGFAEKSRLAAEYLSISFDFFRRARRDCAMLLAAAAARGWRRVALIGAGELAEIAVLSAAESGVEILAVVDAGGARSCAGRPVLSALSQVGAPLDAVIITDLRTPQACYDATLAVAAAAGLGPERVLTPLLLHITPGKRASAARTRTMSAGP
jgi:hypothetical protein